MMGIWFVSSALGLIVAGILAGEFRSDNIDTMPALYTQIVLTTAGSGLLLALFVGPIRKLMGDVK
jgi:POT family proton-dependent oligopeptide transporter